MSWEDILKYKKSYELRDGYYYSTRRPEVPYIITHEGTNLKIQYYQGNIVSYIEAGPEENFPRGTRRKNVELTVEEAETKKTPAENVTASDFYSEAPWQHDTDYPDDDM